jgi:hypothetical protein
MMKSSEMKPDERQNIDWLNTKTGKVCAIKRYLEGGNNLLGEVSVGSEKKALKLYFADADDGRDRSGTEFKALSFLEKQGCEATPRAFFYSTHPPRLLMEWLEGEPAMLNASDADFVFSAEFLAFVAHASAGEGSSEFSMASESCLSDQDILSHIESRCEKLSEIDALDAFFVQFNRLLKTEVTKASVHPWFSCALAKDLQKLIPADFSLHNVIRQNCGSLKVFDFEYFGWDDPAKGVADFLLHPGMSLSANQRGIFLRRAVEMFEQHDPGFFTRLKARYNLFALRWALIVLKPFSQTNTSEQLKKTRLDRAREFLKIVESDSSLPY